jgi:hypothetical protein
LLKRNSRFPALCEFLDVINDVLIVAVPEGCINFSDIGILNPFGVEKRAKNLVCRNSSKTGRTDFRETDVQQPKTTATLSWVKSWRAFSAKSGQLDAGSTTIG